MVTAKNDFKLLLKETKLISYKSHDMINESEKHYKDIVDVLKVKLNYKHLTLLYGGDYMYCERRGNLQLFLKKL